MYEQYDLGNLLSIMIPVFNEELLLPRAMENIKKLGVPVFVLDSYSSDRTLEIAESYGCRVYQGQWDSFSDKLNWGLAKLPFTTPWVMRVDADEYLTEELIAELKSGALLRLPDDMDGVWVRRRFYFLGRWIKHGGMYPQAHMRIIRLGKAHYEHRRTDEHVILQGTSGFLHGDIAEDPSRGLLAWLRRHLIHAESDCFGTYHQIAAHSTWRALEGDAKYRRFLKEEIYSRVPLFVRPFGYWIYRYFLRLGFLDGVQGLIYHFLHAFWYRFVIDALLAEAKLTGGASVKKELKS